MNRADLKPPRRTRAGMILLVAVLHFAALAVLIRAFTPELGTRIVGSLTRAFDVPLASPPPSPTPDPAPAAAPERAQGAAGAPGKVAKPRETVVPRAVVAIKPTVAPPVAGSGEDRSSGARSDGAGAGAAGSGAGTGSGASGSGQGGGGGIAAKPVKIAGDINSARDYPRESRDLRLGAQVVIALRVGIEGRVKACRVVQASPDPEADRVTCRLAAERFRFKPARDAQGNAVEAEYGWRQRWFLKSGS
ncbi:TonB family protein [Novosphingobium lindaniclasticum]|nr:TonB family protein [Novosphingobium lindaniclasticum]